MLILFFPYLLCLNLDRNGLQIFYFLKLLLLQDDLFHFTRCENPLLQMLNPFVIEGNADEGILEHCSDTEPYGKQVFHLVDIDRAWNGVTCTVRCLEFNDMTLSSIFGTVLYELRRIGTSLGRFFRNVVNQIVYMQNITAGKHTRNIRFETLVEWYLKSLGARTEIPSKNASDKGEGDADVIGYFENIKTAIMVQVKKHEGVTDEWAIQQIKAYKTNHIYDDYHTQMWVISTCEHYSPKAMNEAAEADVRLITGIEFASMILNAGLEGLNL